MIDDIIFHIVKKEEWKKYKQQGNYTPESIETQGFIHCSTGSQISKTANREFQDEKDLFLLVIDRASVKSNIKYEEVEESEEKYPHIYGPLNTDAVIDKIELEPDENGQFEIKYDEY